MFVILESFSLFLTEVLGGLNDSPWDRDALLLARIDVDQKSRPQFQNHFGFHLPYLLEFLNSQKIRQNYCHDTLSYEEKLHHL